MIFALAVLVFSLAPWVAAVETAIARAPMIKRGTSRVGARTTMRLVFYAPLLFAILVVAILCNATAWAWYANKTPIEASQAAVLTTIAASSLTAWAGSLIAFTISPSLTPGRAHGLRFLLFAFFSSLVPLLLTGATLRTVALISTVACGLIAAAELSFQHLMRKHKLTVDWKPTDTAEKTAIADPVEAVNNWFKTFSHGGRYWAAMSVASALIFISSTAAVVGLSAMILLGSGLVLVYRSIVEPFTPKLTFDSVREWAQQSEARRAEAAQKSETQEQKAPEASSDSSPTSAGPPDPSPP